MIKEKFFQTLLQSVRAAIGENIDVLFNEDEALAGNEGIVLFYTIQADCGERYCKSALFWEQYWALYDGMPTVLEVLEVPEEGGKT
jgi:hypothetical protein